MNRDLWIRTADELIAIIKAFDVEQKAIIKRFDDASGIEISYQGIKDLTDIPYVYDDKNEYPLSFDGPYGTIEITKDLYFTWFWQKLQDVIEKYIADHPNLIEDYELDWYSEVSMLINFK